MIQKGLKKAFQIALIPVIGGIVGLLFMAVVFLLPTGCISMHVQNSLPMLMQETEYFSITPTIDGSTFDNYTEAIYLNEALVNVENASLIECILSGYRFQPSDFSGNPLEALTKIMVEPGNNVLFDASKRFFNGYETVVKPLLVLTDYSGIRQINLYLSIFLSLLLIYLMTKRKLQRYVLPVIVSLLFIRPLTLALNMTFFGFYVCMLLPCICILLLKTETLREKAWLLFGITGSITFYYNMNYIQLLSFGMPVMIYFLVVGFPESPLAMLRNIAYLFIIWLVGYAGMMVLKWVVYAVLIDNSIFQQMIDTFLFRTGVDRGSRLSAIMINIETAFGNNWWNTLELVFIVGSLIGWFRSKRKISVTWSEITLFAVVILLTAARYYVLSNHVIIHNWVTYRLIMMPVLTFNILITRAGMKAGSEEDAGI